MNLKIPKQSLKIISKTNLLDLPDKHFITQYRVEGDFLFTVPQNSLFIGIDPGTTNMGIAYIDTTLDISYLYQISIPRETMPYRIIQINNIISRCIKNFYYGENTFAVIEGASYGGYRQVELAEVRTICITWLYSKLWNSTLIRLVPPKTIRKEVFGNGNTLAQDVFITDEKIPDALAALSCAYMASNYSRGK